MTREIHDTEQPILLDRPKTRAARESVATRAAKRKIYTGLAVVIGVLGVGLYPLMHAMTAAFESIAAKGARATEKVRQRAVTTDAELDAGYAALRSQVELLGRATAANETEIQRLKTSCPPRRRQSAVARPPTAMVTAPLPATPADAIPKNGGE